jgi:hypothetical protein
MLLLGFLWHCTQTAKYMNVHGLPLDFIFVAHWRDGITLYHTTWHNTLIMVMDGLLDGWIFILILCFIFHCILFKLLAVFILFWWLVSISNCSLFLACKTSFHKLNCVEGICIMRSFYVFYDCLFLMHILQAKIFLYIYLNNVVLFPSNLISPLSMKSEATVPQNVKDGLLKQCISSIPCKFKSVERIILYKINFSLVYMWKRSLIGMYCDFKLESNVLSETETQPCLNVWL